MIDLIQVDEHVERDLGILDAMRSRFDQYLSSESLFYPLDDIKLPRLTLGGYLMRLNRVLGIVHLLPERDALRLAQNMVALREATAAHLVRLETKGNQEAWARVRQWGATVGELADNCEEFGAFYHTAVESRVMVQALVAFLANRPLRLSAGIEQELAAVDRQLLERWRPGPFIWPAIWRASYAEAGNWWLYGQPC